VLRTRGRKIAAPNVKNKIKISKSCFSFNQPQLSCVNNGFCNSRLVLLHPRPNLFGCGMLPSLFVLVVPSVPLCSLSYSSSVTVPPAKCCVFSVLVMSSGRYAAALRRRRWTLELELEPFGSFKRIVVARAVRRSSVSSLKMFTSSVGVWAG